MPNYRSLVLPAGFVVVAFVTLFVRDLVLIVVFGEFEPQFSLTFNITVTAIFDAAIAVPLGFLLFFLARSLRGHTNATVCLLVAGVVGGLAWVNFAPTGKRWRAKRAVRYVYWRNFEAEQPLPSLDAFKRPRLQALLHGFVDLETDPWGRPYRYELISDTELDHPHRQNWDIGWAFWSNGPDGLDDGHNRRDDIDVTNSGL